MLYLDTSALAKLYLQEAESNIVWQTVQANTPWLATSRVTYAEMLSVFSRCLRDRRLSQAAYNLQKRAFLEDWSGIHSIELTALVLSDADRLIERYGLRGLDAIQLCSALWIGQASFACFDDRLRNAALSEGLRLAPS